MLASSKPIHCFSPLGRKLDVGWPRIEDFQLRGHSCVNNVQRCLCHFYTWMRHSKQTATLLLTKHHANFDTSTSAKGYARVCTNCACAIVVLGILLAQARPTMPCIHLVMRLSMFCPTPPCAGNGWGLYGNLPCKPRPRGGEFVVNWGFDVRMLSFIKCEARQT